MAEHVEKLAAKMKDPNLIPRTHIVEGENRRDGLEWSSDLHVCFMPCMHPHYMHDNNNHILKNHFNPR